MVITAKTTYTAESLRLFQEVAARRLSPFYGKVLRPLYLLGGAAVLGVGAYYALAVAGGDQDFVAIVLAAGCLYLGGQLLWMGIRYYDYFARQAMRKIPAGALENFYSFEAEQVVISNRMRSGSYSYSQFGAVCETEDYFFFYFSRRNGYILAKDGIQNASAEELRGFLNGKLAEPVVLIQPPEGPTASFRGQ